jgi:hypothetical protein
VKKLATAIAITCGLTLSAQAHARHHHFRHHHYTHYSGGRPAAWCGWFMRSLLGGGPEYNLARNWAHWGHPSGPHIGAVVVWRHHVGKIVGQSGGQYVVLSGNDGHRVRARPRSLAGAIAFRD